LSKLNEKWMQFNKEREETGLEPVTFEEWFKHERENKARWTIKYLGYDREAPNWGTKNKQEIMKRAIHYFAEWKSGLYDQWVNKLCNRLCLTPRTVKSNYLDPLIFEGIITRDNDFIVFKGPPEES